MFLFEPAAYGDTVSRLLEGNRKSALGPGTPNSAVRPLLAGLTVADLVPSPSSTEMAACCLSALWLWHDYLDESHEISQDLPSVEGSYWHGIMHRREPDYSNAKYWHQRVGEHTIFPDLLEQSASLATRFDLDNDAAGLVNAATWDPYAFVDLCAAVAQGRSSCEDFCREVATLEWQLLFDHCYRSASTQ